MKIKQTIKNMKRIILLISILLLTVACQNHVRKHVYKTKDGKGYCYQDDNMLWYYIYYNQATGMYDVSPVNGTPSYDTSAETVLELSSSNTANFGEVSESMGESEGTSVGGSDSDNDASGEGMGSSEGSSEGGSDSGSDSGGGDGGGGDGGGGE